MATTLAIPRDVPERLRDIAEKLYSYGYRLEHGAVWVLSYPPGDRYGRQRTSLSTPTLEKELLKTLRSEEKQQHVLHRYEQFDARWGKIVYGDRPGSTTIARVPQTLSPLPMSFASQPNPPVCVSYYDHAGGDLFSVSLVIKSLRHIHGGHQSP